jgi:predicted secreted protein
MSWKTVFAIYVLFWVISGFLVLPFEARGHDDTNAEKIPGQADGAPAQFRPRRAIARTTIVATTLFGLFYANYVNGWVTLDMLGVART